MPAGCSSVRQKVTERARTPASSYERFIVRRRGNRICSPKRKNIVSAHLSTHHHIMDATGRLGKYGVGLILWCYLCSQSNSVCLWARSSFCVLRRRGAGNSLRHLGGMYPRLFVSCSFIAGCCCNVCSRGWSQLGAGSTFCVDGLCVCACLSCLYHRVSLISGLCVALRPQFFRAPWRFTNS